MKKFITIITILTIFCLALSACSSNSNTNEGTTESNDNSMVAGDWEYSETKDNATYKVKLDLENNNDFELEVDEEKADGDQDSKAKGIYTVNDDMTLTLTVASVENATANFTDKVVANSEINLNYTLSDDGKTLSIDNLKDYVPHFTDPVDLVKTENADTTDTATTDTSAQNLNGDWKYTGTVDQKNYEIELDLKDNSEFELNVDEESTDEVEDSEAQGTYVVDGNKIKLSIVTVQDASSYFTGTVVQNGQVDLDYKLSDDGKTLTLNNAPDSINFLPGSIDMMRTD